MSELNITLALLKENDIKHCDDFRDWFSENHPYNGTQRVTILCHGCNVTDMAWDDGVPGASWPVCNPARDHKELTEEQRVEVKDVHDILTMFSPRMCRAIDSKTMFSTFRLKTLGSITNVYLDEEQEEEFLRAMKYNQLESRIIPHLVAPLAGLHARIFGVNGERIHSISDIAQYKVSQ